MSDTRKFGTWLLDQSERQDTTGTLARAWQHLRDANGHVRQTSAKAIGELMKGALGEDWDRLRGDESMAEAVKEWERRNEAPFAVPADPEPYYTAEPDGQTRAFEISGPGGSIELHGQPQESHIVQPAVLVVNGAELLLEPGKRYVLSMGVPNIVEDVDLMDAALVTARAAADSGNRTPLSEVRAEFGMPDEGGHLDWAALWGMADHTVPNGTDLAYEE